MPVYNKSEFLKRSIESVINQTLDFSKQIQLILVNDGSTDESAEICLHYKHLYPNNVVYAEIENSGPSAARNVGVKMVSVDTEFIGFLDADDKYQRNTLERVSNFFSFNKVDMAVIPVMYFNSAGLEREHALNYRFKNGDKVISILDLYKDIHFYAGGAFFKQNTYSVKKLGFNESISFWEDALLINEYLISNPFYGVISGTYYYYRRKEDTNLSIVDDSWNNKKRFTFLVEHCYKKLITESIKVHGRVIPYIQYLLIYHMKLFLYKKNSNAFMTVLSKEERESFILTIINILKCIDEKYILEQHMKHYFKEFLISLKKSGWPLSIETIPANTIRDKIVIKKKRFLGWGIKIEGYFTSEAFDLTDGDEIVIRSGDMMIKCTKKMNINKKIEIWGETIRNFENAGFVVFLPLHRLNIEFYIQHKDKLIKTSKFNYYKRVIKKVFPNRNACINKKRGI
jgi:glycosyltransferase involved in cell wall biosynthesis